MCSSSSRRRRERAVEEEVRQWQATERAPSSSRGWVSAPSSSSKSSACRLRFSAHGMGQLFSQVPLSVVHSENTLVSHGYDYIWCLQVLRGREKAKARLIATSGRKCCAKQMSASGENWRRPATGAARPSYVPAAVSAENSKGNILTNGNPRETLLMDGIKVQGCPDFELDHRIHAQVGRLQGRGGRSGVATSLPSTKRQHRDQHCMLP